jgi:ABC-type protease/lipase transport system fused ATPase/permease subunit
MVLEKDKLSSKQVSDPNHEVDSDGSDGAQKAVGGNIEKLADDKAKLFKPSSKKKMQLSWDHIHIKAIPKMKKCGKAIQPPPQPKVILNEVSGTVLPGQFLAIIGASGKKIFKSIVYNLWNRCWKDNTIELPIRQRN